MNQSARTNVDAKESIWVARPLEGTNFGGVNSVSEKIGAGKAFLKVVAYPWGVEFSVFEKEERK